MTRAIPLPKEFTVAGVTCGVKDSGHPDLALFTSLRPCTSAGTFTQNRVAGAPVIVSRQRVPSTATRAVVINSGNANACTGERGITDARRMTGLVAELLGVTEDDILVCSTGVIGHFLPMERIETGIRQATRLLGNTSEDLCRAARAMMTTDTVQKVTSRQVHIDGKTATVTGVAKGAAMIAPNMATMLGVVMTDADIPIAQTTDLLRNAVSRSFNCISVEGHTSTSDSVLLLANGASGVSTEHPEAHRQIQQAVNDVCEELAQSIVRDAEGADHFVTVEISGLPCETDARRVAKAVSESPLVKTAITGNDPNWGRIVSAAGYAGVPFQEEDLSLDLNGVTLYQDGRPVDYDEAAVSAAMKTGDVAIHLRFRLGTAGITYWTCDLTAEYIRLNADYTT